jgi:hypothetical protein
MGGAPCIIIIHALVRFKAIPTDPTQLPAFDAQMRQCLATDTIAQSVANDNDSDTTTKVWNILEKDQFNDADRVALWNVLSAYKVQYS